jgi:hypothetical protein
MSELGEMVGVVADVDDQWDCPFEHRPMTHDKENFMPPPETKNNAKTLGTNLETESKRVENIPVRFQCHNVKYSEEVQFTPHHIIPGNESWPSSTLFKWVAESEGLICKDIGYDVNAASNGVDLPGHTAASSWTDPSFQERYAFNAIVSDTKKRQFHDRHAAYSDFVVNVLNKIASKLEAKPKPGCGKKHCGGSKAEPFDPPYQLLERLDGVALRLEKKLTGDARRWKAPLFTSRLSLMFCSRGLSQDEARKALETDKFDYSAP